MGQESEISRLEQVVQKLLARFSEVRDENSRLRHQLEQKERDLEQLQDSLSSQQSERGEISARLGRIVAQLEEWEQDLDDKAPGEVESADDPEEQQPPVREIIEPPEDYAVLVEESPDKRPVSETGDDEGRVQHKLFSVANPREE